MLERLATCLCHPKRIGMFFKDKFYYALIIPFILFILLTITASVVYFNSPLFTHSDSSAVTESVLRVTPDTNLLFDSNTNELTGDGIVVNKNGVQVYFLRKDKMYYGALSTYDFKKDEVTVYYGNNRVGTVKYSSIGFNKDLLVKDIVSGADDYYFTEFVDCINNSLYNDMALMYLINFTLQVLFVYVVTIIFAFGITYFFNPTIGFKMRLKLIIYSTSIYFVIMIFYLMFMMEWIKYVALAFPVIYSVIALMHIRKVKKTR